MRTVMPLTNRVVLALIAACAIGCDDGRIPGIEPPRWSVPVQQVHKSTSIEGQCEVMHAWGRTAVVAVKSVTLTTRGDEVILDAEFDQPVLDGRQQTGYFFRTARWSGIDKDFTEQQEHGIGENQLITTSRRAIVNMRNGRLNSVLFDHMEAAHFDIPAFIQQLEQYSSTPGVTNTIDYLKMFDRKGMRHLRFRATF